MRFGALAVAALALIGMSACAATQLIPRYIHGLSGPAIGNGNSTEAIDEFPLGEEIPGFEGYNMRARYILVAPGGHIRIHNHTGRPAFSYIVNVPVIQYRSDRPGQPIAHEPGSFSADNDIGHWWRNNTDQTARWYVVDIYQTGGNAGE
jgi:quercetin dioxygenase-like cupin family protein